MRKVLVLLFLVLSLPAFSQYWQQQVNFNIEVSLNDQENTLTGFETIDYTNHSPDTLRFIWFHVWPNAYKNDRTAFSDQLLENGDTRFYFSDPDQKGYINKLDFKVDKTTANWEDHPEYIDVIKVILPSPLPPGKTCAITTPFHVQLPYNFSRGGHDGQSYQVTQWYPKPAVYDQQGWHPMPYLDQGEFYSEFGNFQVSITVPRNYVVAATGALQTTEEESFLTSRKNFDWHPVSHRIKLKSGSYKTVKQLFPLSDSQTKTLVYQQDKIHDFAWFADKRFIVDQDTCHLPSGKIVRVHAYCMPDDKNRWRYSVTYARDALRFYSENVGEYPYNDLSVVEGPKSFGGGMEYPTITVISPIRNDRDLDITTAHEIGHNWFYGILASNERDHPWMDEGINTFYENRYEDRKYGLHSQISRLQLEAQEVTRSDQPIETRSVDFSVTNYDLVAYKKTAEWLRHLESVMGTENFDRAMKKYYQDFQFRHVQPADFEKAIRANSPVSVDSALALIHQKGLLPNEKNKGTQVIIPFNWRAVQHSINHPSKERIVVSPVLGFNSYDKLMIGAAITNYKLPPSSLEYLFTPMFATGSKKFAGLGMIHYGIYPARGVKKIDIGLNASTFTMNEFNAPDKKLYFGFQKLVPTLRVTLNQSSPRSTLTRYIQFKSFFLHEQGVSSALDSVITGTDTTLVRHYGTQGFNSTLNQLQFVIENHRALYPYRGQLQVEQGDGFVRAAFTGKYFFNYSKGGGLDLRLFAGKFFYTTAKTTSAEFGTDRYHLNMTGADGYEDYTYSDYFLGRNKFQGLASQQIMERDGDFKIRTDLLANKIGKTDDWLIAANLNSTLPDGLNPFSLLPFKVPLRVFVDIGTYADAWQRNSTLDHFLYDAGLEVSILNQTVNIYVPLLYSSVYKDYIQSTIEKSKRFFTKISFSIDISRLVPNGKDPLVNYNY